jgi:hypothetical protein
VWDNWGPEVERFQLGPDSLLLILCDGKSLISYDRAPSVETSRASFAESHPSPESGSSTYQLSELEHSDAYTPPPSHCRQHRQWYQSCKKDNQPISPRKTFLTPRVGAMANKFKLFDQKLLQVATFSLKDRRFVSPRDEEEVFSIAHENNPLTVIWGASTNSGCYKSVTIDGQTYHVCHLLEFYQIFLPVYQVGDNVMVFPGQDCRTNRAKNASNTNAQSTNPLANMWW